MITAFLAALIVAPVAFTAGGYLSRLVRLDGDEAPRPVVVIPDEGVASSRALRQNLELLTTHVEGRR